MNRTAARVFSLLALLLFSGLVLAYLWHWRFDYFHRFWLGVVYTSCVALVAATHLVHGRSSWAGWRLDNLAPALASFAVLGGGSSVVLAAAGLLFGSWNAPSWRMIVPYFGWALLQQHVLQNFLRLHARVLVGANGTRRRAGVPPAMSPRAGFRQLPWLLAAAFFAVYHLPNPWLVFLSLLMAYGWCALFAQRPNLLAAASGQTLLTVALVAFFKFGFIGQMEVGAAGFRFDYYGDGVKVAGGSLASGQPFVATLPGSDRGKPSRVRIFDLGGRQLSEWVAFPEWDFSGEIAAGDLGFGPGDEVVVTPGPAPGNPPVARIFSTRGQLLREIAASWLGAGYGAWPAVNCGRLYLGAGPGPSYPQRLLELDSSGRITGRWEFAGLPLVNGLRGLGLCRDTNAEQGSNEGILIWGSDVSVNPATLYRLRPPAGLRQPLVLLDTTFGVQATLLRAGQDSLVAAAPGPLKGYPGIIVLKDLDARELARFAIFEGRPGCGANLSAVDADQDGVEEIVAGQGNCPGQPAEVRIYSRQGRLLSSWQAYPAIENARPKDPAPGARES